MALSSGEAQRYPECVNKDIQRDAGTVVSILNDLFEQKHYGSLSPEELMEKTGLVLPELRKALDSLLSAAWIEKANQSLSGYRVRLTLYGKTEFDRQTNNHRNAQIREKISGALAKVYETSPHAMSDFEQLVKELGFGWNAICFNLRIMETEGRVRLSGYLGAGHAAYTVILTERGKAMFDNPESKVLFISHAAVDKPIAVRLREALEYSFPNIRVFVSSAADVLKPGDPWVQKILDALKVAKAAIILSTERGLTRQWVWYEAGAAWAKGIDTVFCCLGKQHKGKLPAPFSLSQGVNLNDSADLKGLFDKLAEIFDRSEEPDFNELGKDLDALDHAAEAQFEKQQTPQLAEKRRMVIEKLSDLNDIQKEALRLVLITGEVNDQYALRALQQKGFQCGNWASIYPSLELSTAFIQQVPGTGDLRRGDHVKFRISPEFKSILSEVLFPSESAQQ
jgi:hypothetical protein